MNVCCAAVLQAVKIRELIIRCLRQMVLERVNNVKSKPQACNCSSLSVAHHGKPCCMPGSNALTFSKPLLVLLLLYYHSGPHHRQAPVPAHHPALARHPAPGLALALVPGTYALSIKQYCQSQTIPH
jgi:hypothetical protein